MSNEGYITESSPGDNSSEALAASKNLNVPQTKFSTASYKAGKWGDNLAKRLHDSRYLYATYGALDGLSNICSHWRYVFDMLYNDTDFDSDDKLHEFLASPEGMALVGIETIATIAFATIGNYYDPNDKNHPFLGSLALIWPYVRDCFKGSKNAYKGIRSTLSIGSFLSGTSLVHYVVPSAIVFGLLSIIDRLLMRYMYSERKKMMKNNATVWFDIQSLDAIKLSPQELEEQANQIIKRIQTQSRTVRNLSKLGAGFGGFIDGLYLYLGVVTLIGFTGLAGLGAPTAIFLIGCSVLYSLSNIAVRLYDEHDYQKKLDISISKANLALIGKRMECIYHTLRLNKEEGRQDNLLEYVESFERQRELFIKQVKELRKLNVLSYKEALLLGISHGLSAYGAVASIMFAISTITFLITQTLPPVLLIAIAVTIAAGLLFMTLFAANALYHTYQHHQKLINFDLPKVSKNINELRKIVKIERGEVIANKPDAELEATLNECMVTDAQPLFFYMEIFEVVRSFFSGVGKGPKSLMTTFNALEEKGEDGHYHFDSVLLFAFTSVSSCVYAICLALRAYARGFGRPPLDQVKPLPSSESPSPQTPSTSPDDIPVQRSKSSTLGMFAQKEPGFSYHKSHSDTDLYIKESNEQNNVLTLNHSLSLVVAQ